MASSTMPGPSTLPQEIYRLTFLSLPPEVRTVIYTYYFNTTVTYYRNDPSGIPHPRRKQLVRDPAMSREQSQLSRQTWSERFTLSPSYHTYDTGLTMPTRTMSISRPNLRLLLTCRTIYNEAIPIYHSLHTLSYIEADWVDFLLLCPLYIQLIPSPFWRNIKRFQANTIDFIWLIDDSLIEFYYNRISFGMTDVGKARRIFRDQVLPNLDSFVLDTEIWKHKLMGRSSVPAWEVYEHFTNMMGHGDYLNENDDDFGYERDEDWEDEDAEHWFNDRSHGRNCFARHYVRPLKVIGALQRLAKSRVHIKEIVWRAHLLWLVRYMPYGTIHSVERFGWNTYVYDARLDTMTYEREGSWSGEREVDRSMSVR